MLFDVTVRVYPFSGVTNYGRVWRKGVLFDVTMRECPFSGITSYGRVWRKDVLFHVTMGQHMWQELDSCRVCSFEHHEKFCNLEGPFWGSGNKCTERSAFKVYFESLKVWIFSK